VLVSGGLDGMLAAWLAARQGLRLEGVHFRTGFNLEARAECVAQARCGVNVEVVDVTTEYFREVIVRDQPGLGFRGCRSCHGFMVRRAADIARERGIEWLVTGDVVGQRAHGLRRDDLIALDERSGLAGRVLRPLSARLLPPTAAESEGAVDRDELCSLHGRSRREQIAMARLFGIEEYPVPAGACCRLEERSFASRVRDVVAHPPPDSRLAEELEILGFPRQYRVSWRAKVVFGRDEPECRELERKARDRVTIKVEDGHGSLGVVSGSIEEPRDRSRIASLAARHSRSREFREVRVAIEGLGEKRTVEVRPATADEAKAFRI